MKFDILKPEAFAGPGGNDAQEVFLFPAEGEATIHDKLFIVTRNVGKGQEQSGVGEYFARTFADAMFQNTCADEPLTDEILREALLAARDVMEEKCPGTKGVQFAVLYMHRHGCLAAHLGDTHIYHVRPKGRKMLYKSKSDDRSFSTDKQMVEPLKACITNVQYGDYFVLMAGEGSSAVADREMMDVICEPVNDKTKAVRLKKLTAGYDSPSAAIVVHVSGVMREAMDEELTDNETRLTAPVAIDVQPTPRPQPKEEKKTTPPKVEETYEEAPEREVEKSGHEFPIVTVTALALVLMAVGIWFWAQKPVEEKTPEAPVEVKKSNEKDTINILKNTRPKPVTVDDPKAEEKKKEEEKKAEEKPKPPVEKTSEPETKPDSTAARPYVPATPAPPESSAPQNPTPAPATPPANQPTTTPPPAGNDQGTVTPRPVIPDEE